MTFAVIGAIAAMMLAACGEDILVVDNVAAEEFAAQEVQRELGGPVESVSCPDDVEVEKGKEFECEAEDADGATATITMRIERDNGDFSYVGVEPN